MSGAELFQAVKCLDVLRIAYFFTARTLECIDLDVMASRMSRRDHLLAVKQAVDILTSDLMIGVAPAVAFAAPLCIASNYLFSDLARWPADFVCLSIAFVPAAAIFVTYVWYWRYGRMNGSPANERITVAGLPDLLRRGSQLSWLLAGIAGAITAYVSPI